MSGTGHFQPTMTHQIIREVRGRSLRMLLVVETQRPNEAKSRRVSFYSWCPLTIRSQPPKAPILTDIGQTLSKLRRHHVRQGHADFGFIARVSKHDTLITGSDIQVRLAHVDTSRNIGRLLVDADQDFASFTRQSLGLDRRQVVFKGIKTNFFDLGTDNGFVINLSLGSDFPKDHDHVVFGSRFASNLGVGIGLQTRVQDGVRDLVGQLVGVTFVDGFRRKEEITSFGRDLGHDDDNDGEGETNRETKEDKRQ